MTNKENGSSIPESWKWTTVGEIYDVVGGGTPSTAKPEYWNGDIPWITSADVIGLNNINPRKYVTPIGVQNSATNVVPEKSIIVVTRVGLGKLGLAKTKICFSQDCHGLIGNNSLIAPEYSLYYLSTAVKEFKYKNRGTTIPGVTKKQLCQLPFPLPPANEQKRISSKIEELFSFLDAGTEVLRKIRAQLKRYRHAVLKYAFEGKQTEEWRKKHGSFITSTSKAKNSYGLPAEWVVKSLSEIAEIQMGQSPPGSSYGNSCQGIPLLNGPTEFGVNHPNPKQWTNKPTQICKNGDLLICVRGNTTGRMNWADQEYCIGRGLASITPHEKISNRFFVYYFLLQEVNEIMRRTTGSTFPNLKSSELKNFELPLPPYEEQNIIVQIIDQSFSIAYNTEKTAQIVLLQANNLRQSILKNAFEGKLVPHDPSDEPAEMLLKRLKNTENYSSKNNPQGLLNYVK